ncbi:MAG: hypothetical protein WCH60_08605 [Burkholderiales bacterium]
MRLGISIKTCLAAWAALAGPCAFAQAEAPFQISSETGVGYESQTSPLIRLSPQGELISLDGLQRLGGTSYRIGLQTFANWQLGNNWGASLAADFSQKKLPTAPDFDFGMVSIQPSMHMAVGTASVGWGGTLQRIDVGGRAFREVRGAQFTWTLPQASGNLWMAIADLGSNRHGEEFSDLDASTASVTVQHHVARPLLGLEGIDIAAFVARERNEKGFVELSHTSAMLSTSIQWRWQDILWSAGASLQHVQFDGTAFASEPLRVDRATGIDLAAEHKISGRTTVRIEYSEVRNVSSISLYDNSFQQFGVKFRTTWQ